MRYRVSFARHPFSLFQDVVLAAHRSPGLNGHLDRVSGELMVPDLAALSKSLPAEYRASLRRNPMGAAIWFDKWHPDAPAYVTFRNKEGLFINAAYFTPIHAASAAIN